MSLSYSLRQEGGALVVALSGSFTFSEHSAFRKVVEEVTAAQPKRVTVDLEKLTRVDSAGLSMLVLLRDRVGRTGGTVQLRRPPAQVARILDVVDFSQLFEILN